MVRIFWRLSGRWQSLYWRAKSQFYYRALFGALGERTRIIRPLKLAHPELIYLGDNVNIAGLCWLGVYPQKEWNNPKLMIGDGCEIGHLNHITCVNQVRIGAKVLTADRVHISDNQHEFADITLPVLEQGVTSRGPVEIGDGTWLGEGVNVLSCRIGRNCVIGANSVVLSDIPDFCVAVGTPARVIKRYDKEKKQWIRVSG